MSSLDLLERRWFAAAAATQSLQAQCAMLFEALKLADAAWRRTRAQLAEFQALQDALEQQLAGLDAPPERRGAAQLTADSAA
jgi:hypothetical protein